MTIAATSLKISCTNLYSVKSYDETNVNVFALSLWEWFSLGLPYFDEFIYLLFLQGDPEYLIPF